MNREHRHQVLRYKHARYEYPKSSSSHKVNNDTIIQFTNELYTQNLSQPVEAQLYAHEPHPQVYQPARQQAINESTKQAIISQLLEGNRFESTIKGSELLKPAYSNVGRIWTGERMNQKVTLGLSYYVKNEQADVKKRRQLEKNKKQKHCNNAINKKQNRQVNRKLLMTSKKNKNSSNVGISKIDWKEPVQKQLATETFNKLHQLWCSYIANLGTLGTDQIFKIELHGAKCTVVKSSNANWINKSGIIIKETCNMFQLWTSDEKCLNIPKQNNVFDIQLDDQRKITIYGNNFMFRSAERTTRKFTRNDCIDL
jgi:RNase P/RNase MRP subunit p29